MAKEWYKNSFIMMVLSATLFIGGYFFLRLAYHISDKMPFTQEIILIVLGTLATVLITAMLLNKQTEVELEKEKNVKFLELKTQTYLRLIDNLEEIVKKRVVDEEEINKLMFNTHRLAIFASPSALAEYQKFLSVFNKKTEDGMVSIDDANQLSQSLARLTVLIRKDLIGELDDNRGYNPENIKTQILSNATSVVIKN